MLPNTLPLDTTPPPPADTAAQRPRPRTDSIRDAGRPRTATPAAVRQPIHRHSPLPAPLQAHRRQGGQGVYPQTQTLHGSYSTARATQGPGPPRLRYPGSGAAPPTAVRFRDFPPPRAAAARRVHFAPQQPAEPCREPFSPGTPPAVFARPAAVLNNTAARPARNRRPPSRLDL